MQEPLTQTTIADDYFAAEEPLVALLQGIEGIKDVTGCTDYESALKRLAQKTPSALVYYDGDDPVRQAVEGAGASVAVQNWFVVLVDRGGNDADGSAHRERVGGIVSAIRTRLPGQRVVRGAKPLELYRAPYRKLMQGGAIAYVFQFKLRAPLRGVRD